MKRPIVSLIPWIIFLSFGALIAFAKAPTDTHTQSAATVRPSIPAIRSSVEAVEAAPMPSVTPTPQTVTWRDNPNNCDEATQWIAESAPFACIDKPQPVQAARQQDVPTSRLPAAQHIAPSHDISALVIEKTSARWGAGQVPAMLELVRRESSSNPYAVNPSSGACGIPQALPCSKLLAVIGSLDNVPGQVQWMVDYVAARYGTPANAIAFHNANNWY